jgi:hypothetical protein
MKTILYYTSNQEKPEFEKKIINKLLKNCGGLPIISVSQKPMDLGKNICVGNVGHSYLNLYRQQLVGAKKAKTEYLVFAEADFLYPKEYFELEPTGENVYLYNNVWILHRRKVMSFRKKSYSHGAQIVKRDYLIERLEKGLKGLPEWFNGNPVPWLSRKQRKFVTVPPFALFHGDIPCISFKTGDAMNMWTAIERGKHTRKMSLPYWGNAKNLRKEFL